jgi:hypothetical protein
LKAYVKIISSSKGFISQRVIKNWEGSNRRLEDPARLIMKSIKSGMK